jgi:hypothetical protein
MRNVASPSVSESLMSTSFGSISPRQLAIAIFLLAILSLSACQRIQRPYAGENKAAADAPTYTQGVNLNGVPQGN